MFSRLLSKKLQATVPQTPPDCVIWAIGDIHGRSDLADRLIQAIRSDLEAAPVSRKVIVPLGDYVDRGPDSKGVLDQICNLQADPGLEVHCLKGNHEEWMEAFLTDPALGPSWCDYGGLDTMASYGVSPPKLRTDDEGWAETSAALAQALPASHRRLLASLEYSIAIGDYFFCHAGAKPGVPLADQTPQDLLWIRDSFLNHPGRFEQIIVHGHTPSAEVISDHRRIGADTGAYATNVLSAVRLAGETRVVLQATGRGTRVQMDITPLGKQRTVL